MATLNEIARTRLQTRDGAVALLDCLRNARETLLPMYRQRFHARLPDPGENLRHCALHDIAFYYLGTPSAFKAAWSDLRELGKLGNYSDEDVDKQIGIMLSELDQIEAEVGRIHGSRDDAIDRG